jgi:iron complex outermembrane receptor protein
MRIYGQNSVRKKAFGQTGLVTMAAALLIGEGAWAADAVGIEEILVSARKREERLLDTPVAVSALPEAVLDQRNLRNLTGISQMVPNLVFDVGTGSTGGSINAQVFIRGIGQQDFLFTSDPGVGLYIDGVYFPRVTGIVMDMVDLEQVEVLRGPQGTLFGKNTIGGAILISTKKPGNEMEGMAQAIFGSRDRVDLQASVNLPIVEDKFAVRVSASSRNQDGYVKRINVGDTLGDTDSQYARLQARWTPDETWTIDLSADVTRKRETTVAAELIDVRPEDPSNALLGLWNLLVAPTYGPDVQMDRRYLSPKRQTQATGPNFSNFDMFGVSLVVEKDVNELLTVKSISSYRDQDAQFSDDTDHSPLRYTESDNDNKHELFSQELQINGRSSNDRLKWVLGGFYMHEKGSDVFNVALGGGLYDALESLPFPLVPLVPGVECPSMDPFAPCAGGAGNPLNVGLDLDVSIFDDIKINSYAVYGEASYDLSDKLNATLGVRYSYDKKTFTTALFRNGAGMFTIAPTTIGKNWDRVTPRGILKYTVNDNAMIYVSVTGGFKSGGFNGRATSLAEIDSFDPERVWAYEVGAKTVWLDNRLGINVAGFYNDYSNMQLLSVRDVQGVLVVVTENAGKVQMKGFEAEVIAVPVENLNLRGAIGFLDAEYDELAPNATVTLDDMLVKAPKWTMNAGFDYTVPMGNEGRVTFGGSVYYRSKYANELTNEPVLIQNGYALLDAFIQYTDPKEVWSATFFGTNLTDKRFKTNGLTSFGSFGNAVANYGPPREWGIKLRINM